MTAFNKTDTEHFSATESENFVNNIDNEVVEILYFTSIEYIVAHKKKHLTNSVGIRNSTPSKRVLLNFINFLKPPMSYILVLFLITGNQIKLTYKLRVKESQATELNEYSNDHH